MAHFMERGRGGTDGLGLGDEPAPDVSVFRSGFFTVMVDRGRNRADVEAWAEDPSGLWQHFTVPIPTTVQSPRGGMVDAVTLPDDMLAKVALLYVIDGLRREGHEDASEEFAVRLQWGKGDLPVVKRVVPSAFHGGLGAGPMHVGESFWFGSGAVRVKVSFEGRTEKDYQSISGHLVPKGSWRFGGDIMHPHGPRDYLGTVEPPTLHYDEALRHAALSFVKIYVVNHNLDIGETALRSRTPVYRIAPPPGLAGALAAALDGLGGGPIDRSRDIPISVEYVVGRRRQVRHGWVIRPEGRGGILVNAKGAYSKRFGARELRRFLAGEEIPHGPGRTIRRLASGAR